MGSIRGVISHLAYLAAKLLPGISSSSTSEEGPVIGKELIELMCTLERIKATLNDAEEREIRNRSVTRWLQDLREVIFAAEDVLDEYHYEVWRAEVESRGDSAESSRKWKKLELPNDTTDFIKKILGRFEEVEKATALQLHEEDGNITHFVRPAPTSPLATETSIFGRELESEELVNFLLSDYDSRETVSVIPIVGEGGIGKTTLARLVYNNHRARKQFNRFGWIDLFNKSGISWILKSLIDFFSVDTCGETELTAVQRKISEEVRGTTVLLVLDDVSISQQSGWQVVLDSFRLTKMTRILVTTRNDTIAQMMSTCPPIKLGCLPEEQCWSLFQHYAFDGLPQHEKSLLGEMGREIMKKCGGRPLSVKLVASLLRYEVADVEWWIEILISHLWETGHSKEIFAPLQLSYFYMPTNLKPCFLFCSMFPKNYSFEKNNMVKHWISQGYVHPQGDKTLEETANEYFQELIHRSFFERICDYFSLEGEYDSLFMVHDMIHDLAQSNSKCEHCVMEFNWQDFNGYFCHKTCHLHIRDCVKSMNFPKFVQVSHLLTLVVDFSNAEEMDLDIIVSAYNLRSLELRGGGSRIMLPELIGNLKLLCRLYIGSCEIETLPESISHLHNLQILTIFNCPNLKEFPIRIEKLVNLHYLNLGIPTIRRNVLESICLLGQLQTLILDSPSLDELPESIGNLVDLRHFVVTNAKIRTLPKSISHLTNLRTLGFCFCRSFQELPNEIGNLTKLENLILRGSRVCYMPLVVQKLTALQRINATLLVRVENNGPALELLKDLVNLKGTLYLYGLEKVASLEDAKGANLKSKQFIEKLSLNWSDWRPIVGDEIDEFTLAMGMEGDKNRLAGKEVEILECFEPHQNLRQIEINGYNGVAFPKWVGDPLSCKMLKSMQIESHNLGSLYVGDLPALKILSIISCSGLEELPEGSLPLKLESFSINRCLMLKSIAGLKNLKSLTKLDIQNCPKLHSSQNEPLPSKLVSVHIENCAELKTLVGIQNLTSIKVLRIIRCHQLSIPAEELLPSVPYHAQITECPRLQEWCQRQNIRSSQASCSSRSLGWK